MDNREIINETLVHLFHEIQKLEEEAIITEDFKDLTNNDMHIIEAVGLEGGNMSSIAAKLDITVGHERYPVIIHNHLRTHPV